MEFQKYNSLEQAHSQKMINAAVDAGYANIPYVVTEKVHGANFGIHWEKATDQITFSRRSGFLEEGETFYAHVKIEVKLIESMRKLLDNLERVGEQYVNAETATVYGEIFGGTLNGKTAQGSKRVQKEVQYSPETEFAAFDLIVDGNYVTPWDATPILDWVAGFYVAPIIGMFETLEEALAVPNDAQSRIPFELGYTVEGDNIIEGTVIRPLKEDIYLPNGKHFILKSKNEKFKEKGTAKVAKVAEPLSDEDTTLHMALSTYLTENRLNAVISKEKEVTQKDFGRILGLFMQDAIAEYEEQLEYGNRARYMADEWDRVNKSLQKIASQIVRKYWTTEL